jgi:pimeloyl-ACP methyl ester carboxylesterase
VRVRLGVLLAVVGGTLSIGAAEASAAFERCGSDDPGQRSCQLLTVPLDRTGAMPGTVRLRIERAKAKRSTRPPLFTLAGGPGQSGIEAFDDATVDDIIGTEGRSRDVVVMDVRGTGGSGLLSCPALQRGRVAATAACAAKLGPRRDYFSSVDVADDIDAVRAAFGYDRIALLGVSYGTYLAQTYARRHPERVDRLVLDSVVGPDGVDAFERSSMHAAPLVIGTTCGNRRCRSFTRDAAADVRELAARLDERPLAGLVTDSHGRRHRVRIDGSGLLDLIVADDFLFPLRADVPAAVRSALLGDPAPLLRARKRERVLGTPRTSARHLSATAYVATLCSDTRLPWPAGTPIADRRMASVALAAALPAGAFAPFGAATAATSGVIDTCANWPSSSRPAPPLGPLPDVPALLLAGGVDVRTPVENARAVAQQLPSAQVLISRFSGHGVLSWDESGCASGAVRRFLAGGEAGECRSSPAEFDYIMPPAPTDVTRLPRSSKAAGRSGRTLTAVTLTIADGFYALFTETFTRLAASGGDFRRLPRVLRAGVLRGGSLVVLRDGLALLRASYVPGVRVSGAVRASGRGRVRGTLRVAGPAAARGRLTLRRGWLAGTLGGRSIRVRYRFLAELARQLADKPSGVSAQAARQLVADAARVR